MSQAAEEMATVEAVLTTRVATAEITRYSLEPTDHTFCDDDAYRLDLALTPRPSNTRARFCAYWGPHRFEPLGRLFLQPVGQPLQFRTDGGRQDALLCKLQPDMVREWLGQDIAWSDHRLEASLDIASECIRNLMWRLAHEMRHPGFASAMMTELIAGQIVIELGRYCASLSETPAGGGLPPWRLRLIEERLAEPGEPPTLTELARLCNLSVRQLTRGFRASRSCSIGDHIAQSRIESAKRLLAGGQSIKVIAASMGFSSPSSFSYAFRRASGMTPREFRNNAAERPH